MDPTRQRLLDAAGQTFAAKGFAATTVRDICRLAGANIAAVNYHFGDKQRLYIEAVKHAHCHSEAPLTDYATLASPEEKLERFVREMLVKMLDDASPSWHMELVMREMGRPTSACEEVVRSFIGPMFETLTGIVRELLPSGASDRDCHVHAFSVVGQCLMYRFHRPVGRLLVSAAEFQQIWNLDLLTRHITDFSLAGLRRHQADAEAEPMQRRPQQQEAAS